MSGRPNKRKKRYNVHYDRLITQLLLLAVIVFAAVWLVSLCSRNKSFTNNIRQPLQEAVEAGRRDAEKVLDTAPGSMQRDDALLFIRAREQELRSNGHGHAADDYIEAARVFLEEHNIR